MLAQVVRRLGAKVEHLSPAAQDKKLVDFVLFIWKPGIWFDKFCVVRLVKAVELQFPRAAAHKIVPQLARQRLCQRGNARGVEVHFCAQLLPAVDHSRIRCFADGVHMPAERRRKIALIAPVERIAAELFGAKIGQRRLVIGIAVLAVSPFSEEHRDHQHNDNERERAVYPRPAIARHLLYALAILHRALKRTHLFPLLRAAEHTDDAAKE